MTVISTTGIIQSGDVTYGWHNGAAVSAVASQQDGPGFDSESGGFRAELACFLFVCECSLYLLHLPKIFKLGFRLIGHSKWPVGVDESVCLCLSSL